MVGWLRAFLFTCAYSLISMTIGTVLRENPVRRESSMTQVLAIDQGTTNSKAVLVDDVGAVRAVGSAPVGVSHPRPGWVEQDPELIWTSVLTAVRQCLDSVDPATV